MTHGNDRRATKLPTLKNPAVTLVLPVFETEDSLRASLESVLRQTFDDFELIVVDDRSVSDATGIVEAVAADDARLRLVRNGLGRGALRARFAGARHARGEFLGFVDVHDEVEDFFLMQLHTAATRQDADFVDCSFVVQGTDQKLVNRGGTEHALADSDILYGLLAGSMSISVRDKLFRLSTWREATARLEQLSPPGGLTDDLLLLVHIAISSRRFVHTSRPAYRYIPRPASVANADRSDTLLRDLETLDVAYRLIRSALDEQSPPRGLVEDFFSREFLSVGREMLGDLADLLSDTPAGLARAPKQLGLLGAVALFSSQSYRCGPS